MKKSSFQIGIVILVLSLLLIVTGPVSAGIGECELEIHKEDPNGKALAGATFVITPNPYSNPFSGELIIVDNGLNDEDSSTGVLRITGFENHPFQTLTITETVAPPGYTPAPPQITGMEECPIVLTFINELTVGGEAQSINTIGVVVPWIGLFLIGITGIFIALKRRSIQT